MKRNITKNWKKLHEIVTFQDTKHMFKVFLYNCRKTVTRKSMYLGQWRIYQNISISSMVVPTWRIYVLFARNISHIDNTTYFIKHHYTLQHNCSREIEVQFIAVFTQIIIETMAFNLQRPKVRNNIDFLNKRTRRRPTNSYTIITNVIIHINIISN